MKWPLVALGTIALFAYFLGSLALTAPCGDTSLPLDPWFTPSAGPDNSACLKCHECLKEEKLVQQHNKSNIGCVKCHGKSESHVADEKGLIAPDKMFGGEGIDKMCAECHDDHDVPAAKVVTLWLKKCPERESIEDITCMDCHGEHKMEKRTTVWDKKTRKLISKETPKKCP